MLIAGAGPAGLTAALNLAPIRRTMVVDVRTERVDRPGEMLVAAARRMLADMGLLDGFLAQGHPACHGIGAAWGDGGFRTTSSVRDLDGSGWLIDRARFAGLLREAAVARGAALLRPASVVSVVRCGERWRVSLATIEGELEVDAAVLIDAGGRGAALARRLGARRHVHDRLICGWLMLRREQPDEMQGLSLVEAAAEGWWYTSPQPDGSRFVGFHTDADLPAAGLARAPERLRVAALAATEIGPLVRGAGRSDGFGLTAAHGGALEPCAGPGWFAVGDAALSFDPLAGQGLFNALFTGLAAAEAADRECSGDLSGSQDFARMIGRIAAEYRASLSRAYRLEGRWPHAAFWQRRLAA